MEQAENSIVINCCMKQNLADACIKQLEVFFPVLKEEVTCKTVTEQIELYIESGLRAPGMVVVTDNEMLLPRPEYYRVKACKIYLYIREVSRTKEWVRNPLIDGIIFEGSDTTIISFLKDIISWKYRMNEQNFLKPIAPWVKDVTEEHEMLTVSFGKMAHVYNELKKFIYFEHLHEKFNNSEVKKAFENFASTVKRSTAENIHDHIKALHQMANQLNKISEKLKKQKVRNISILLTGESGVGKSLLAGYIQDHFLGGRKNGLQAVKINCSQLTGEQIRTELFGATLGTYTDQSSGIPGKILENAMQVLIMDEIADMDVSLQPQLLSYLDDSRVHMLNFRESIFCPVVLICTTNKDIDEETAKGHFRKDLYQRFDLHLHIPPLRERKEEIKPFIKMMFARMRAEDPALFEHLSMSKACLDELCSRDYTEGNFREISRSIQHTVRNTISRGSSSILLEDLR